MKVSSKSWHFKLAQYGGMKHFHGLPYPTVCKYTAYALIGAFWGIFDKFIFRWVLPLSIDLIIFIVFHNMFTGDLPTPLAAYFLFVFSIYFIIVCQTYIDKSLYYGPLWVLRRFTVITKFISKFCGKVEIEYEKE
jgi:hypothetical protein